MILGQCEGQKMKQFLMFDVTEDVTFHTTPSSAYSMVHCAGLCADMPSCYAFKYTATESCQISHCLDPTATFPLTSASDKFYLLVNKEIGPVNELIARSE